MTATLAKFLDMDNIPKKYGGNLDWKFGDMPNLEPAIADSLRWREQFEQNGHKTLPIGPIKLQYDEQGDLLATAIGTEDGKARQRVIAGLHPEDGVARLALSPGRVESSTSSVIPAALQNGTLHNTSASPATAPTTNGTIMSSDADPNISSTDSSKTGTYLSYQDSTDANNTSRAGTSETRYVQQSGTHAEGTLAEGTPALKIDSQGEKQALMDPNTVGQAPKEHPLPIPEEPAPSMMDQAKGLAGQAVEGAKQLPATVMGAVGMGGQKEEPVQEQAKKEDPAVDAMEGRNVEEFLRSQTMSKPEA